MKTLLAQKGFVLKKRNYFDRLNIVIWFTQLVISFVLALS